MLVLTACVLLVCSFVLLASFDKKEHNSKPNANVVAELSYDVETLNFGEITQPYVPTDNDKKGDYDDLEVEPNASRQTVSLIIYDDATTVFEMVFKNPKQTFDFPDDPTLPDDSPKMVKIRFETGKETEAYDDAGKKIIGTQDKAGISKNLSILAERIEEWKKQGISNEDIAKRLFHAQVGVIEAEQAEQLIYQKNSINDETSPEIVITTSRNDVSQSGNQEFSKIISHIDKNRLLMLTSIYTKDDDSVYGFSNFEFDKNNQVEEIQTTTYETSPTTAKYTMNTIKTFENVTCVVY